ncbi:MAG TPA: hypothetical protein DET40_11945 [Lentisphaeria bacterium]|nr:MAG: hypothetical protein A2X45_16695 [Lentisphaerae bacterium GWF2_50_93]HCE44251.1 hypothetical protein [Lentisphaeria bacterium]
MKWLIRSLCLISLFVGVSLFSSAADNVRQTEKKDGPDQVGKDKKVTTFLYMGHSFFMPIAEKFKQHPPRCGFTGYRQFTAGAGGDQGAPGNIWKRLAADAPVRKLIEAGQVDAIVLTYYPNSGSELSDYERWVDYGLKYNAGTQFYVVAPWPKYNHTSLAEFEKDGQKHYAIIKGIIEQLQKKYKDTKFTCIPQGLGVIELRRRFEKGEIPELAGLCKEDASKKEGEFLFIDKLGHGDKMIHTLSQLIWLAVIFNVDVRTYDWDTGYKKNIDLKTLAWQVAQGSIAAPGK